VASFAWRGGRDISDMQVQVKRRAGDYRANGIEALKLSITEGAALTEELLELAITPTGLIREERGVRGGRPGRHLTGNMVDKISHNADSLHDMANRVIGSFGWFAGEFEQYFRDQDLGEGNIPAARALPTAYEFALQAFRRRMDLVARGKSVS